MFDSKTFTSVNYSVARTKIDGISIITTNPRLHSTEYFKPLPGSPCINAGMASSVTQDIHGNARPSPVGSFPDIGAYEVDQSLSSTHSNSIVESIKVYPNPTSSEIYFSESIDRLDIYNEMGELIESKNNVSLLDMNKFESGIYVFRLLKESQEAYKKVFKISN